MWPPRAIVSGTGRLMTLPMSHIARHETAAFARTLANFQTDLLPRVRACYTIGDVFTTFWNSIRTIDYGFGLRAAVDVLVVAFVLYRVMLMAKGGRAWQILFGLMIFFGLLFGSERLGLLTFHWLLTQITPLGPVALLILFYPEMRGLLERMGRPDFWGAEQVQQILTTVTTTVRLDMSHTIDEVVRCAMQLSPRKTGALIVLERETGLDDVIATGTPLNARVSAELLATLFHHGTPLHDGAAIVKGGEILAAGCTLPLTDSPNIAANIHTRHRAAIGLSETSDAVVVVVSEETGTISLAVGGKLVRGFKADTLRTRLTEIFGKTPGGRNNSGTNAGESGVGTAGGGLHIGGLTLPFGRNNGASPIAGDKTVPVETAAAASPPVGGAVG